MSQVASHHQTYQLTRTDVEHIAVIVGDFNMDWLQSSTQSLISLLLPGFRQLLTDSTTESDYGLLLHQVYRPTDIPTSATQASPISLITNPLPLPLMLASITVDDNTSDTAASDVLKAELCTVCSLQCTWHNLLRLIPVLWKVVKPQTTSTFLSAHPSSITFLNLNQFSKPVPTQPWRSQLNISLSEAKPDAWRTRSALRGSGASCQLSHRS